MHVSRKRVLMLALLGGRRLQERLNRHTNGRKTQPLPDDRPCSCLQWKKLDVLVLARPSRLLLGSCMPECATDVSAKATGPRPEWFR